MNSFGLVTVIFPVTCSAARTRTSFLFSFQVCMCVCFLMFLRSFPVAIPYARVYSWHIRGAIARLLCSPFSALRQTDRHPRGFQSQPQSSRRKGEPCTRGIQKGDRLRTVGRNAALRTCSSVGFVGLVVCVRQRRWLVFLLRAVAMALKHKRVYTHAPTAVCRTSHFYVHVHTRTRIYTRTYAHTYNTARPRTRARTCTCTHPGSRIRIIYIWYQIGYILWVQIRVYPVGYPGTCPVMLWEAPGYIPEYALRCTEVLIRV